MFEDLLKPTKYYYIDSEIKQKNKAYIILNDCCVNQIEETIDELYVNDIENYIGINESNLDKILIEEFNSNKYKLNLKYTIQHLTKKIEKTVIENHSVSLEKIEVSKAKVFVKLINEIMNQVPGSVTYTLKETKRLIESGFNDLYLIKYNKDIVGIVEISFEEDIPELISIGVLKEFQNKHIAKTTLKIVENILVKEYDQISIDVAIENEAAYHLYKSLGYTLESTKMQYYLIDKTKIK